MMVKPIIVSLGKITNLYEKLFIIEKIKNITPNDPITVAICSRKTIWLSKRYSGVK